MKITTRILSSSIIAGLASVASLSAHANIASTIEAINALSDGAGYQINDVILTSELQRRVNTDSAVQQAYYALLGEIGDGDNDNTQEPLAMRATLAGYTPPTGGGFVPVGSLSPKVDGYGMPMGYCAWDHGTTNASTDRISGDLGVTNNHVNFVVLSSGRDRAFDTSCADAASGTLVGDDHYRLVTVGEGHYGVATNQYFGKPVASLTDLLALDTSLTQPGELRVVLEEGKAYAWLDLNSDGTYQWDAISGGGSDYFHAGDSNGATAGGEYSSTPYDLGVGARFVDTNLVPRATLEVDGRLAVVDGDGLVDTTGGAQLHVGNQVASAGTSGEVARLAIQPYGHTGGPFNFIARDVGPDAFLDLRYGSSANTILGIGHTGEVGIGTASPDSRLTIVGGEDAQKGPNLTLHGTAVNQFEGGRVRFTEASGRFQGAYLHYDASVASGGILNIGVHETVDQDVTQDRNVVSIVRTTGRVGINTQDPQSIFHLKSSAEGTVGKATLIVEADQDDNVETDNPSVRLVQDGRQIEGMLGLNGNADVEFDGAISNTLYLESARVGGTGSIQFVTGRDPMDGLSKGSAKMTIDSSGRVGVGTVTPQTKMHIQDGDLRLTGDTRYVSFQAYRAAPVSSSDDDLDGYEHLSVGVTSSTGIAHLSGSNGLSFMSNIDVTAGPQMHINEAGDVGIGTGTSAPDAQLHLFRNSNSLYNLKVENGGGQAKGLLIAGGNTGSDASLLRVESYDATQRFFEVSDGRIDVGEAGGSTEFCLNGICSSSVKTTQTGTVSINNSTFTKIAYVEGQRMGANIDMSISGTSTNIVVNTDLKIIVGHTEGIYVESDSQEYTQLEIKIDADGSAGFTEQAHFTVSARTLASSGPTTVKVEASPNNGELIKLNPSETVGGITHTHTTKKHGKSISSNKGGASLYLNNYRVMDITNRNEMRASKDLAVGWYTVATNPGDRASARFGITDRTSGQHQATVFYAEHHFGQSNSINVISNGSYNQYGVDKIRIKEGGTYDGALLQVYVNQATSNLEFMMLGDNFQRGGWEMTDWVPDGTNPGTVNSFAALVDVGAEVNLRGLEEGGISTTGSIILRGQKEFGRSWPTDNANVDNAIILGGASEETMQIFRQKTDTDTAYPTTCGPSNYSDCYIFMMSDSNADNPDGSILFGGVGQDDIFEKYVQIHGDGKTDIRVSSTAATNYGNGALNVITPTGTGTFGSHNTNYFHFGTTAPRFYFDKPTYANGGFFTYSDKRLKKNIEKVTNALDSLRKIRGVSYDWRADEFTDRHMQPGLQYGVIAQELEAIFPDMVTTETDGYKAVQYDSIIPVLIEATKELDDRHQDLEKRVDQHDDTLAYHEKKLKEHEAIIRMMKEASEGGSKNESYDGSDQSDDVRITEKGKRLSAEATENKKQERGIMERFYR